MDFTSNIFYCQLNTDNGSDTSYKLTRSSPWYGFEKVLDGSDFVINIVVYSNTPLIVPTHLL
jgi:hypothetical protein